MSFSVICSPFIVMYIIGIDSFLVEYFLIITICLSGIVYLIKLFNKLLGELIDSWSKGSIIEQRND